MNSENKVPLALVILQQWLTLLKITPQGTKKLTRTGHCELKLLSSTALLYRKLDGVTGFRERNNQLH